MSVLRGTNTKNPVIPLVTNNILLTFQTSGDNRSLQHNYLAANASPASVYMREHEDYSSQ
jgi:hypothetical protein